MSNQVPDNLKYTKEHEWSLIEGDTATVGVSFHAQSQLGDVVYLELPEVGATVTKDKIFGTVESVKAVSDLFSPLSGKVVEVNEELVESPEKVNESPYESGWMVKIQLSNTSEIKELMDNKSYQLYLEEHMK